MTGLTIQPVRKPRIGQRGKGLGDLGVGDALVVDDQPLEQRLVPLTAQMARRGEVGAVAVGEKVERLVESVGDVAEGGVSRFEMALGLGGLGREAVLLGAQEVDRNRARVVGVQELLALLAELREASALAGNLGLGLLAHPG